MSWYDRVAAPSSVLPPPPPTTTTTSDATTTTNDAARQRLLQAALEPLRTADASTATTTSTAMAMAAREHADDALRLAIECIDAFVQINWTGPTLLRTPTDLLRDHGVVFEPGAGAIDDPQALSVDSEDAYTLAQHTGFLFIARRLLVDGLYQIDPPPMPTIAWWTARCVVLQQKLLENLTGTLHTLALEAFAKAQAELDQETNDRAKELRVLLHLEIGLCHHLFHDNSHARESFKEAQTISGLSWQLTGKLGRRLRYQTFDVAQLIVDAKSGNESGAAVSNDTDTKVPKELELNDTDLLDSIQFKDTNEQDNLRIVDQCILLAFCLNFKRAAPADGLTKEEMAAFVVRVLKHPNNWLVHSMGLLLKSRLESEKGRTVERAALQLQALVDQYDDEDTKARVDLRQKCFYQLMYPARWRLQKELGERFLSIGALRSAIELFERLQLWDNIIDCYQYMDQSKKAEELVRQRLDVAPTPKLWCILGDLLNDPSLYEKAWDLSGRRYGRAMRSLGAYHFKANETDQAIQSFELALSINTIFPRTWFALGCAYMLKQNWDKSLAAFTRVISLESSDSEAWTNIASIHLKCGRKSDALRALKEAVKNTYDNWKIWENVLYVSLDLNEMPDAALAFNRLLETQLSRFDPELLLLLLNKFTDSSLKDPQNQPLYRHAKVVGELLDNVTSRIGDKPAIWKAVALFAHYKGNQREALDATSKAYRMEQVNGWERDEATFLNVAAAAEEIAATTLEIYEKQRDAADLKALLFSARSTVRTVKARSKELFEDHPRQQELSEWMEKIKQAEDTLASK